MAATDCVKHAITNGLDLEFASPDPFLLKATRKTKLSKAYEPSMPDNTLLIEQSPYKRQAQHMCGLKKARQVAELPNQSLTKKT